jgi:hypothetical protein
MMRRSLLGLVTIAFLATPALSAAPEPGPNELVKVFAGYRAWKPTTPKPVFVPGDAPCGPGGLRGEPSPHRSRYNYVYVSPDAKASYTGRKRFPAGGIIVKEKLEKETSETHSGLGIMIKLPSGASPSTGDWKYFYIDTHGTVSSGQAVQNCATCHLRAPTDSLFGPR